MLPRLTGMYAFPALISLEGCLSSQGEGSMLATGSYDGLARIWNEKGTSNSTFALIQTLDHVCR